MDVGLGDVVVVGRLSWGGGGLRHPKAEKEAVFALGRERWSESSVIAVRCAPSSSSFAGVDIGRDGGRESDQSQFPLWAGCSHLPPSCTPTLSMSFLSRYSINALQIPQPNLSHHSSRTLRATGRNWVLDPSGRSTKVNPPNQYIIDPPSHPTCRDLPWD